MNIVELKNIKKKYGNKTVLDGVSLTIQKGEMLAITGKSGKGKTTLLNIIGMFEQADSGEIKLFGEPFKQNKITMILREKISYLFQNFALIDNENVDQNLGVALAYSKLSKKEKEAKMKESLQIVGLEGMSLKQKIYSLSGGEQQRVALARAFLKPSELILADEPTGSLDKENRDAILSILKKLNQSGRTIIIVTHDPEVAQFCNRIVKL